MKTSITTLFTLLLAASISSAACPPLDPYTLWLPKDKAFAKEAFIAKAQRLNDAGQCVMEGSYGTGYQKYYLTVSPTASLNNAKILRFTYEELAK